MNRREKNTINLIDIKSRRETKPRVLIDLDGVIRDFVGSLIRVYKKEYPDHEVLPIRSRKLEDFFPIGRDIYRFIESGYLNEIMENADPYPGAIETLFKWQSEFDIVIVTAQPEQSRASTFKWIGKNDLPTNEVIITYYKSEIPGIALLDDFIDNLEEFKKTGRFAVCMDQPWNQHWSGPRVKSMHEFFELIQARLFDNKSQELTTKNLT